jgi:hypothetical protein
MLAMARGKMLLVDGMRPGISPSRYCIKLPSNSRPEEYQNDCGFRLPIGTCADSGVNDEKFLTIVSRTDYGVLRTDKPIK